MDDYAAVIQDGNKPSEPIPHKRRKRRTPISDNSIAPNVVAPPSSSWLNHEPQMAASQNDLDESEKSRLVSRIVATIKEQTKILESGNSAHQQYDNPPDPLSTGPVSVIDVPPNWHRQLVENSVIVYISPSGQILTSLDQVRTYLSNPDVCKCGLTCPFRVEDVFNFDADVATSSFSTGSYHHQSWSMANCYSAVPHDQIQPPQTVPVTPVVKRARGRPRKRKNEQPIPPTPQFSSDKSAVCVNVNALDPNSFIRHPARQMKQDQPPPPSQNEQSSEPAVSDNAVAFVIDSTSIASPSQSNLYVRLPPELLAAFLSQQNTNVIGVNATNQQDGVQQHCFLVPIQALGATISTTPVTMTTTTPPTPGTPQKTQKNWQNDEMIVLNQTSIRAEQTPPKKINHGSACSVQSAASSGYHSANNTPINDPSATKSNPHNQPNGVDNLNQYEYYMNTQATGNEPAAQNQFYFDSEFYQDDQSFNRQSSTNPLLMDMDFFTNPYHLDHQQTEMGQGEFFGRGQMTDLYDHPYRNNSAQQQTTNDINALFGSDCCDYNSVFNQFTQQPNKEERGEGNQIADSGVHSLHD